MKIAIYPGSFDPITNGHIDIIERASKIFDVIIVSVTANPDKSTLFSKQDRLNMIKSTTSHIANVQVDCFGGLLIDYAKIKNASIILRGLRAVSDFDYEFQMAITNYKMASNIETVFLMTDAAYSYLSSSLVKQIARLGGDISSFVPKIVEENLKKIIGG